MIRFIKTTLLVILTLSVVFITAIIILINTISDPHTAMNLSENLSAKKTTLYLAGLLAKRGIKINTIENQKKIYPSMSDQEIDHRQKLESGWLNSSYAWIIFKRGNTEIAREFIQTALEFKMESSQPEPKDHLRYGIITSEAGDLASGWVHIKEAILGDTQIENRDPSYRVYLQKIIRDLFQQERDIDQFLYMYRLEHTKPLPFNEIISLDDKSIPVDSLLIDITMIMFFSPICGSCRQELSAISKLMHSRDESGSTGELIQNRLFFILNQPKLEDQAIELFTEKGLDPDLIYILKTLDPYQVIHAEPSTWIVNGDNKVIFKHTGYRAGDEEMYIEEIEKLLD